MLNDRRSRKNWSRTTKLLLKVADEQFEKATVQIGAMNKGTDWSSPDARPIFVLIALKAWCETLSFYTKRRITIDQVGNLPPEIPLQLGAHLFLLMTANKIFWPRDYKLICQYMPWLVDALIDSELMKRVSENPRIINSKPESLESLMTSSAGR